MVILNTDLQAEDEFSFSLEETAQKVCEAVLEMENCPFDAEVSLVVTDAEEVHRLNKEFREIDRTTDVLSFPGVDFEEPGDFSLADETPEYYVNPENEALMLGDIVINAQRVHEQANEYGHSERREYAFLIAHSMLHLCGYDHMTPEEAAEMEARQTRVLDSLGITRDAE